MRIFLERYSSHSISKDTHISENIFLNDILRIQFRSVNEKFIDNKRNISMGPIAKIYLYRYIRN